MTDFILASQSPFRAQILKQAGLQFSQENADIDERAIEASIGNEPLPPDDLAILLAEVKAQDVSLRNSSALTLGCDQTLSLGDELFHKAKDMEEARRRLLTFSGKTHQLNSALVLVKNGETIWRHVSIAHLTMRELSPQFIGQYLANVGEKVLSSVGVYQIEGEGVQLFDKIEGDYFTIIGLPILPLLEKLREMDVING
jgi:septum formation protein